jgi:hypothetical protein
LETAHPGEVVPGFYAREFIMPGILRPNKEKKECILKECNTLRLTLRIRTNMKLTDSDQAAIKKL